MVRVDAQVADGRRLVTDLVKEDFVITDEGAPVAVEYFGRDTEPLWLMLLLDVSGSMTKHLGDMAAVSRKALSSLGPQDRAAVMLFGARTRLAQDFTESRADVSAAIAGARGEKTVGAGTAINAAVISAAAQIRESVKGQAGRRAIVILTDNGGLSYQTPDSAVLAALFGADTVLNGIVTANARPPVRRTGTNPDFSVPDVFLLSRESGGEILKADQAEAFHQMLERIRTRYSLHYRAPAAATPKSMRNIKVELAAAARKRYPKAEVRARSGYAVPE